MIRPCERSVRCFPCADDNPFANLSAEDPDLNIFLSVRFRRVPNPPHNNWNQVVCGSFCESAISQEDADDCAYRKALGCIVNHQPPPKPKNRSWPKIVRNQSRTCRTDGQCYTIPFGTVSEFSQIEANAIAESLCNHRVHDSSLTSPCPVIQSPPLAPTEEVPCPAEAGSPAPNTLEISSQKSWETHSINNSVLSPLISDSAPCNPTLVHKYTPVGPIDHPPGNYGLVYLDGYYHYPTACEFPSPPYHAGVHVFRMYNAEYNYDAPLPCDRKYLAHAFNPGGFSGFFDCYADATAAQSNLSSVFSGRTFRANPYPPNEVDSFAHSNNGGNFGLLFDDAVFDPSGITSGIPVFPADMRFQVVQIAGLIPQPRKVAISNYAAVKSQFADQPAANAWNGKFPERTVYNSMTVQWAVTAAGAFGGAVLKRTDAHPTSANGKGWQMDIFSLGAILLWRGFSGLGSTPPGRFHKDSTSTPMGPACVECADDSATQWFP